LGKVVESKLNATNNDAYGAYGLTVDAPYPLAGGMVAAPPSWERWHFSYDVQPDRERPPQAWSETSAHLHLVPRGSAEIDLNSRATKLIVPQKTSPQAFLHPHLGSTAVVVGHWFGRTAFHASSFVLDGGVWAILGDKEDGKSSSVAWAFANGLPIMADDLLITRDGIVCAGPRCLDLRPGAVEHFGLGEDIGTIGDRQRWRVSLGAVPAELPLKGWIVLTWADEVGVRELAVAERFTRLVNNRAFKLTEARPEAWTSLLGLPMFELRRPRDWSRIDSAMSGLLTVVGQS
jgi:hypothetical protein